MKIPSLLLRQLYTFGSLTNTPDGVCFGLKNRLGDAILTGLREVRIDGQIIPREHLELGLDAETMPATEFTAERCVAFPLAGSLGALAAGGPELLRETGVGLPSDRAFFLLLVPVGLAGAALARSLSVQVETAGGRGGRAGAARSPPPCHQSSSWVDANIG